jgi:hypothetical protein
MSDWTTEQLMKVERELGGLHARVSATEHAHTTIRTDLSQGLERIERSMEQRIAHVLGEVKSLEGFMTKDRSELRAILTRNQEIIRDEVQAQLLRAQEAAARQIAEADRERARDRLVLIAGVGLLAVGGSKMLDWLFQIAG